MRILGQFKFEWTKPAWRWCDREQLEGANLVSPRPTCELYGAAQRGVNPTLSSVRPPLIVNSMVGYYRRRHDILGHSVFRITPQPRVAQHSSRVLDILERHNGKERKLTFPHVAGKESKSDFGALTTPRSRLGTLSARLLSSMMCDTASRAPQA